MKKDLKYGASYIGDNSKSNRVIKKRNGDVVKFDPTKIKNAIMKANKKLEQRWDRLNIQEIEEIVELVTQVFDNACHKYNRSKNLFRMRLNKSLFAETITNFRKSI